MILSAVFRLCSPAGSPFENWACYRLWFAESHHSSALPLPISAVAHCRDSSPVIGRPWGSILYSHEDHRAPASPGRFMRCVDRSGSRHRRAAACSLSSMGQRTCNPECSVFKVHISEVHLLEVWFQFWSPKQFADGLRIAVSFGKMSLYCECSSLRIESDAAFIGLHQYYIT